MKELKLPMDVKWGIYDYTLTRGSNGKVNVEGTHNSYPNYMPDEQILRYIADGHIKPKESPLSLTIEVKHSALTQALAEAKELEATLLRIKEMLK